MTRQAEEQGYFTTGELADMFGIPKQTLMYYDKLGLLYPEYVAENSYRYYSLHQYMILEIIINLRKMDVPIREIRKYLENRDVDAFEELLKLQDRCCDKIIARQQQIKDEIRASLTQMRKIKETRLGIFMLNYRKEKVFYVTDVKAVTSPKARIQAFAAHNLRSFPREDFKEKAIGWIVGQEDFLGNTDNMSRYFFTTSVRPVGGGIQQIVRPAGLYLTIRFKGTYQKNRQRLAREYREFLDRERYRPVSDFFVMPLKNHWFAPDSDQYINQISLQVEPLETEDRAENSAEETNAAAE